MVRNKLSGHSLTVHIFCDHVAILTIQMACLCKQLIRQAARDTPQEHAAISGDDGGICSAAGHQANLRASHATLVTTHVHVLHGLGYASMCLAHFQGPLGHLYC